MTEFIQKASFLLLTSSFRYILFAGIPFLIFYVLFKKHFQKNKIQTKPERVKSFLNEIKHSSIMLLITALIVGLVLFTPFRDFTQIYADIAMFPVWWIPLSVVLSLVIHDTYFYWMHRAMHTKFLYRYVHRVHHQSVNPSPFAAYSFDILEAIAENAILFVLVLVLPLHPIALISFGLLSFSINVYGHLGYEIVPSWFRNSFLYQILNTSVHHNLHHKEFHGSYGLYFRFWDRMMGTENPHYEKTFDEIQNRRFGAKQTTSKAKYVLPLLLLASSLLCLSFTTNSFNSLQPSTNIAGQWMAKGEMGDGVVEIYQDANQKWQGKLVRVLNPEDQAKVEAAKAEKGVSEVWLLRDFEYVGGDSWKNGKLFLINRQMEVDGKLKLLPSGELKVTGQYAFLQKSRIWKRVDLE